MRKAHPAKEEVAEIRTGLSHGMHTLLRAAECSPVCTNLAEHTVRSA